MKTKLGLILMLLASASAALAQNSKTDKLSGTIMSNGENVKVYIEYSSTNGPQKKFHKITVGAKDLRKILQEIEEQKKRISNLEKEKKKIEEELKNGSTSSSGDTKLRDQLVAKNRQIDSLNALVSQKESEYNRSLENQKQRINELNTKIATLEQSSNNSKSSSKDLKKLNDQIKQLNEDIETKDKEHKKEIDNLTRTNKELQEQIVQLTAKAPNEVQECQTQLTKARQDLNAAQQELTETQRSYRKMEQFVNTLTKELNLHPKANSDTLQMILDKIETLQEASPVMAMVHENRDFISLNAGLGRAFLYSSEYPLAKGTSNKTTWSIRAGYTHYLSDNLPLALAVGIGMGKFSFSNAVADTTIVFKNYTDADGDKCDLYSTYNNQREQMSLTYLDIPISLMYGNTFKGCGIQGWVKVGVIASINVGSGFEGSEGTFSTKAHYTKINNNDVDVWLEDVPALHYESNQQIFSEDAKPYTVSTFALLANLEAGIYIPVNDKMGFTLGAYLTHSLFPSIIKCNENEYMPNAKHHYLFDNQKTKLMNCGVQIGFNIAL